MAGKLNGPTSGPRRPTWPEVNALEGLTFTRQDIARLSLAAGIERRPAVSAGVIARDLAAAFRNAVYMGQIDGGWASASEVTAYYDRVANAAEQLVFALGYSSDDGSALPNPRTNVPRSALSVHPLVYLFPEFRDGKPDGDWWRAAAPLAVPAVFPDLIHHYVEMWSKFDTGRGRPPKSHAERCRLADAFAVRFLLEIAPRAAAVVHALAEGGKRALAAGQSDDRFVKPRSGRGDRPDMIRRWLFDGVVQTYYTMFGQVPRIMDAASEREGPAALWISELMMIARKRIEALPDVGSDPAAQHVLVITGHVQESLADALIEAWRRRKR